MLCMLLVVLIRFFLKLNCSMKVVWFLFVVECILVMFGMVSSGCLMWLMILCLFVLGEVFG